MIKYRNFKRLLGYYLSTRRTKKSRIISKVRAISLNAPNCLYHATYLSCNGGCFVQAKLLLSLKLSFAIWSVIVTTLKTRDSTPLDVFLTFCDRMFKYYAKKRICEIHLCAGTMVTIPSNKWRNKGGNRGYCWLPAGVPVQGQEPVAGRIQQFYHCIVLLPWGGRFRDSGSYLFLK